MQKLTLAALLIVLLLTGACARTTAPQFAEIPAGRAYADGEEIYFSHTEVSDPGVGELLSKMMKSPVLVVPTLAEIPDTSLALVYVFQNGIAGSGPLKFQPDVFPSPPGEDGYTPLRKIVFVNWVDESKAKELKSESEILSLADEGALTLEKSEIVVNMPFMSWNGGKR